MEKYKQLLHEDLNNEGITRYEQLGNISDMLNDLTTKGEFYEFLKTEDKIDIQVITEGITALNIELDRLYRELK